MHQERRTGKTIVLVAISSGEERDEVMDALRRAPGLRPRQIPDTHGLTRRPASGEQVLVIGPDLLGELEARDPESLRHLLRRMRIVLAFRSDDIFAASDVGALADTWLLTDKTLPLIDKIIEISENGYTAVPADFTPRLDLTSLRLARISDLSTMERRVLLQLGKGQNNHALAAAMGMTDGRARSITQRVMTKLRFHNRTESGVFAARYRKQIEALMEDT